MTYSYYNSRININNSKNNNKRLRALRDAFFMGYIGDSRMALDSSNQADEDLHMTHTGIGTIRVQNLRHGQNSELYY